ncbi:hypothetical protein D9Q98_010077 [Chlorella vulgaris]|uniref:Rhamnogalacturonase A/B/Epimerase-like pectate lyase domain-containing protein n=1 Tax=Chlorella vulgaris TaxID=3077 RepID=A0A9D4TMU6_CHLVU|nr:hypothetical protein D9Q98_010077 [Chlorella vulgaris]
MLATLLALAWSISAGLLPAAAAATLDAKIASRWTPGGYDFSRAGYAGGERPIPTLAGAKVFNVKQLGAKGNGIALDNGPVQVALRHALASRAGGVVFFPAGTYLLSQPLYANASNIVLRGAGSNKTRLVFTRSLSQVYGVQWGVDKCTGGPTALWTAGAGMIMFSGHKQAAAIKQVARVVTSKQIQPGATRLPVSTTRGIRKGQWLTLWLDDDSTASKPAEECENMKDVYNITTDSASAAVGVTSAGGAAGGSTPILQTRPLPAKLAADPFVQAALEAHTWAETEGISTVQAAAQDARFRAASGEVSAAWARAKPGTVAAWVYGNNLVDSGGAGAINGRAVRMNFRVTRVGAGFIDIDRDLIYPLKPGWKATLAEYNPGIQNSGIEGLTIAFRRSGKYEGHHSDRGYNGIHMASAANCWIRDIKVLHADNGIFVTKTDFTTVSDIVIDSADRTISDGLNVNGHHAISVVFNGQGNLVTRFEVRKRYWHDLTVSASQKLTVFSRGRGGDMNLDHHRAGPMANLFSDLNLGKGSRPWTSSGRDDRGAHSGRGTVFWNLRTDRPGQAIPLPTCDFGPLLTFAFKRHRGSTCPASQWKVTTWKPPQPTDLHLAQVALRRSAAPG